MMTESELSQQGWGSVQSWLETVDPVTARVYKMVFDKYMDWVKVNGGEFKDYTPDMMLDYQDRAVGRVQKFAMVKLAERFISAQKGITYGYKRKLISTIKSFFMHNECPLPPHPFNINQETIAGVEGELRPEEIRLVCLKSNPLYRAVYLSMLGGGMGEDEIIDWSNDGYESLMKQLEANERIIVISNSGRKLRKNVKGYKTLISGDALDAVKLYLKVRDGIIKRTKTKSNAIFINNFGNPLTKKGLYQHWTKYLKRLGIIKAENTANVKNIRQIRYGKNPHELRDVFKTLTAKTDMSDKVAEFMMGHEIDELHYNKSMRDIDWVKSEYVKALEFLNIITGTKAYSI